MKAFKNFDKDMKCRGIQFEIGKTYRLDNDRPLKLCENGFHFHRSGIDCFEYYDYSDSRLCEIEVIGGDVNHGDDKSCCREFKIIREIERGSDEWKSILNLHTNTGLHNSGEWNSGDWNSGDRNSGDWNSGDWNSGDRNSGDRNSGDWNSGDWNSGYRNSGEWNSGDRNSGDWNSGDWNSGDWNSGDWNSGYRNSGYRNSGDWNSCDSETGFFNSKQSEYINVFNKPCKRSKWDIAYKPSFLYFDLAYVENAKLVTLDYKEAFQKSFKKATERDIELLKELPNFDAEVFYEISGIRIEEND